MALDGLFSREAVIQDVPTLSIGHQNKIREKKVSHNWHVKCNFYASNMYLFNIKVLKISSSVVELKLIRIEFMIALENFHSEGRKGI